MPAPQFLATLPKPILFGLYGAVGGLLGALVFGEPAWQILRPPPPPPAVQPEPQIAVAASKELQLLHGKENSFPVEIARSLYDGPVDVKLDDLPGDVGYDMLTIAKGETTGRVVLRSSGRSADEIIKPIKVVATAVANGKTISAETTVILQVLSPPAPQADVFFVLDVTGSMSWAINGIRDGIGDFARQMYENKIDYRIGLLAFRDLTIDRVPMDLLKFRDGVFTTDVDAFRKQVGKLVSAGGGDDPESSLEAVDEACQQPFRKGATKVLLLITDAPPKVKPGQIDVARNLNIQTFAEERAGAEKVAVVVRDKQIDMVNLVVRPQDLQIYQPLMDAGLVKGGGQFFNLRDTVDRGEAGFSSLIDKFTSSVVEVTAAKNPVKPTVASQAEKPVLVVKGLQSSEQFDAGSQGRLTLAIGVWTGAIAAMLCLALLSGQHHYLRGQFPPVGQIVAGFLGGLLVGIVGGAAGQGLYMIKPISVFQILGWALLGGLAGSGLAMFIPNLKWFHGLAGGAIGGAVGGIGYLGVSSVAGAMVGRLVGGLIVGFCIGLMVAIVEAAFRRAWLEVRYGTRETITVNLGPEPVKIGGDNRACTVWARGAAPVALRYFIRSGQVICEDAPNRAETVAHNGDSREVGNVTVTVRTGSSAAPAGNRSPKPSAAPPLPRSAAPAPPPPALKPLDLGPFDDDPLPVPISPPSAPPRPAPAAAPGVPPRPAPPAAPPRPPVPAAGAKPSASPPAPPRPASPPPAAPKPASGPRDPDACPSCGRKNAGRPGSRYCMLCDQTY